MCLCVCGQHFSVVTYFIKQYTHFLCAYSFFNPFKTPYGCYNIRPELANKPFLTNWFSSTFGHARFKFNSHKVVMYRVTRKKTDHPYIFFEVIMGSVFFFFFFFFVTLYLQKLNRFYNIPTPDDGSRWAICESHLQVFSLFINR